MKKTIPIESVDPIEIYGAGNRILTEFCSYFPKLKVTARGHELMLEGRESDIEEFSIRFAELVERRHHKLNLTIYDVEDIFDGENSADKFRLSGDAVIVHGTDGKPIKARNHTQQEMVKAYFDNDLVFAVGPAGTGKTYIAIALAVRALKNREIKRVSTKPTPKILSKDQSTIFSKTLTLYLLRTVRFLPRKVFTEPRVAPCPANHFHASVFGKLTHAGDCKKNQSRDKTDRHFDSYGRCLFFKPLPQPFQTFYYFSQNFTSNTKRPPEQRHSDSLNVIKFSLDIRVELPLLIYFDKPYRESC